MCASLVVTDSAPLKPIEQKPIVVQVLPIAVENGVDPSSARVLTEFLATDLGVHKNLKVFGESDLQELMQQAKERKSVGCEGAADSCLAEVAGALGAQWLVTGTVGQLGEALVLSVRILDTHKHNVLAQGSKVTLGQQSELLNAVNEIVPELLEQIEAAANPKAQRSPLPYVLGAGTVLAFGSWSVFGIWTIVNYEQNNSARNAFLHNQSIGTYAGTSQYSSAQSTIRATALVADVSLIATLALGIGTAVAW